MIGLGEPLLIGLQVLPGRLDEVKHFLPFEDVIPDGGAAEIDVEVRVGAPDTHKAILLHLRPGNGPVVGPDVVCPA